MNNPMIDVIEEITLMAEYGFDFIDLTLEPEETYSATVDVNKIARTLEQHKMGIVGHTAWYLPVASAYPDFRNLALQELERCLKVFRDLGATKMNLHPYVKVPLHNEDWIITHNIESLASLVDAGKEMGISIMLENMPHFSRVSQIKPILESVPDAQLLLDVGHANLGATHNHAEELLAHFGDRLGHVHVSDNRGGQDDLHLPLGVGNINWLSVVRLLKNVGYDGTITVEVFGDDDDYLVMSRDKIKYLWENTEAGEVAKGTRLENRPD
ncbi:MAG: sugar phosphate isomerase/epimerase family protein [Armatimonadota bacterium]